MGLIEVNNGASNVHEKMQAPVQAPLEKEQYWISRPFLMSITASQDLFNFATNPLYSRWLLLATLLILMIRYFSFFTAFISIFIITSNGNTKLYLVQ
jgi:hypothetical protein